MRTILHAILVTSAFLVAASEFPTELQAGCSRCGAQCATRRVCRTICTTKSVECTEWGEACREVCLPPRSPSSGLSGLLSRFCGLGGHSTCDGPTCDDPACDDPACSEHDACVTHCDDPEGGLLASHGPASWFSRLHGSCDTRVRKKLMRKTITTQVPVTECIVEDLCPQCCVTVPALPASPSMQLPQLEPPAQALPVAEPPVTEAPRTASHPFEMPAEMPAFTNGPAVPATPSRPFFQTVGDDMSPATTMLNSEPLNSEPLNSGPLPPVSQATANVPIDASPGATTGTTAPASSGGFFQQVGGEEPVAAAPSPTTTPTTTPAPAAEAVQAAPPLPDALPLLPPARDRTPAATLKKSARPAGKFYNYAPVTGSSLTQPPAGR